jgi:rSAM/selenodomain-associated transferase 2
MLTVVVPALNEAAGIQTCLQALAPLRALGHEVILVDGGSTDATAALAAPLVDRVITDANDSIGINGINGINDPNDANDANDANGTNTPGGPKVPRGRAAQMNAGAALARGQVLLFLHADTQLPANAAALITQALQAGARWGRFDVQIEGRSALLPLVGAMMNWRSRLTGIATGDQALFVDAALFRQLGGFAAQPLMEDIELSRRLRAVAAPACLRQRVRTSGRRWDQYGALPTIVLMWWLRWRYWRGASPELLAQAYR